MKLDHSYVCVGENTVHGFRHLLQDLKIYPLHTKGNLSIKRASVLTGHRLRIQDQARQPTNTQKDNQSKGTGGQHHK